jgi:hypothetical protein
MCSARLSAARRGSMIALALAASVWSAAYLPSQAPAARMPHAGAILVQTVDTSINPLAAEIVLPAFGLGVRLSEEGAALLMNIPDGLYLIQARHLGHRPEWRIVRIAGDTARAEFVLAPAQPADGQWGAGLAEARLRDFLRRSGRMQLGSFVTRSEIERRRPRNLVALLSRIPEVTTDRAGPGPTVVRSGRALGPECASGMLLFVDGTLPAPPPLAEERPSLRGRLSGLGARSAGGEVLRWSSGATGRALSGGEREAGGGRRTTNRTVSALDWVPISIVAGVEVYPIVGDVPPEFRVAGAECGVVLVWTVRR